MTRLLRLTAAAAVLFVAGAAQAQTPATQSCPTGQAVCVVDNGQYLNRVINGDTTSAGDRVQADRIYQLQRDAIYLMDADVRNDGYHLQIIGQDGDGEMPWIFAVLNSDTGNPVGDPFGMQGDITFRNFAMAGVPPESLAPELSALPNQSTRVIRVRAPGFDLTMDNVVFVNFIASIVRAQSALRSLTLTNSVWANSGWLGSDGTNFGAGKGIDLRDGSIEQLTMQNNTFVNFTDRVLRHRNSTGAIQNMLFDHNTLINTISYHGALALGVVGDNIQITNNLFYDGFAAGSDSSDVVRQEEFNESGEFYPNGNPAMQWIFSVPNDNTTWTIANNAYVVSDEMQAFYQRFGDGGGDDGNPDNGTDGDNDIIDAGDPLSDHIRSRISNPDMAFQAFAFDLANAPEAPVDMLTWYRTETGRTKETNSFTPETDDYDRRDFFYYLPTGDFDASYPTDTPAYTLADNGCPAGDLNWFDGIDQTTCLMGVSNEDETARAAFGLSSGPNPFGAGTTVRFSLETAGDVSLSAYDALGRKVGTLAEGPMATGDHAVRWNAAGLAAGVYVLRLEADGAVASHRVTVVR